MFRAITLTTVLTLVIAPNAAAFCGLWCEWLETATTECTHQEPTTSVLRTGDDNCTDMAVAPIPAVTDDARRGFAPDSASAVDILRLPFTASATDTRNYELGHRSLLARPLNTALRI